MVTGWIRTRCDSATCVEVRRQGPVVQLRSTTYPAYLDLSVPEWREFVAAVKRGEFDGVGK